MSTRRRNKMPRAVAMGVFLILGACISPISVNRAKAGLADHIVINEVQIYGYDGIGGAEDDWLELYNPTGNEVVLNGWTIQKFSEIGNLGFKLPLTGIIKAGGYLLIVREGPATNPALVSLADIKAGNTFSLAQDNIIYLVNSDITVIPATPGGDIVDFVGFGSADFSEGMSPAAGIANFKSISRVPDGEDTDNNAADFELMGTPTPTNSDEEEDNEIGGTVLLTITPDAQPTQNITANSADIVFKVNADGLAQVNYGPTNSYGTPTAAEPVIENVAKAIGLSGLNCGTTYHYAIYAENTDGSESDTTADAAFTTLPCGIALDSLVMTKTGAKANNQYVDGWAWEFNITVWDTTEISLKMKFNPWSGTGGELNAGGNMQFSVDNGVTWIDITGNAAYPATAADLTGIDLSADAGRQVKILVRMKVPAGTVAGYYGSSYGILTE